MRNEDHAFEHAAAVWSPDAKVCIRGRARRDAPVKCRELLVSWLNVFMGVITADGAVLEVHGADSCLGQLDQFRVSGDVDEGRVSYSSTRLGPERLC